MSDNKEPAKQVEPRVSQIKLSIKRSYNIAKYESLQVEVGTTDDVSWSSLAQRQTKVGNLTKLLTKYFQNSKNSIFTDLQVQQKNVSFKSAIQQSMESAGDQLN